MLHPSLTTSEPLLQEVDATRARSRRLASTLVCLFISLGSAVLFSLSPSTHSLWGKDLTLSIAVAKPPEAPTLGRSQRPASQMHLKSGLIYEPSMKEKSIKDPVLTDAMSLVRVASVKEKSTKDPALSDALSVVAGIKGLSCQSPKKNSPKKRPSPMKDVSCPDSPNTKRARNAAASTAKKMVAHLKSRTVKDGSAGTPWPRESAEKLIEDATSLMAQEKHLRNIDLTSKTRLAIVGDLHGQFEDLVKIMEIHGEPSEECQYLFNGDYVDRGANGIEVLLTIYAWKVALPKFVHINRGNHEEDEMNTIHGFYQEVIAKYDTKMYKTFQKSFSKMPIAHVVQGTVLVVHGGLPRTMTSIQDILKMKRVKLDAPAINDLVWSDPHEGTGDFGPNHVRGGDCVVFGATQTKAYLEQNGLSLLIRSHECKEKGWDVQHDGLCVTVFSAANYVGVGNEAAFLELSGQQANVEKDSGVVLRQMGDLPNLGTLVARKLVNEQVKKSPRRKIWAEPVGIAFVGEPLPTSQETG